MTESTRGVSQGLCRGAFRSQERTMPPSWGGRSRWRERGVQRCGGREHACGPQRKVAGGPGAERARRGPRGLIPERLGKLVGLRLGTGDFGAVSVPGRASSSRYAHVSSRCSARWAEGPSSGRMLAFLVARFWQLDLGGSSFVPPLPGPGRWKMMLMYERTQPHETWLPRVRDRPEQQSLLLSWRVTFTGEPGRTP